VCEKGQSSKLLDEIGKILLFLLLFQINRDYNILSLWN